MVVKINICINHTLSPGERVKAPIRPGGLRIKMLTTYYFFLSSQLNRINKEQCIEKRIARLQIGLVNFAAPKRLFCPSHLLLTKKKKNQAVCDGGAWYHHGAFLDTKIGCTHRCAKRNGMKLAYI